MIENQTPLQTLHVIHQYLPEHVGGTEIYTQSLTNSLRARDHGAIVFARGSGETPGLQDEVWKGVRVLRAQVPKTGPEAVFSATFGHAFLEGAFRQALETARPDLVHFHHLMGLPASLPALAREAGLPVIATLHDYWFLCPNAQLLTNYDRSVCSGPRMWLNCARCATARLAKPALLTAAPLLAGIMGWRAHLLRGAIRSADRFIAPTAFVRDLFAEAGLVAADRIVHIPHGIDTTGIRPRIAGRPEDPLRIAYLGGISWQKGVHILIDAVVHLEPADVDLLIYGDLTAFPDYRGQLIEQAAGHPHITFAGRLSRDEVWEALARTDVLVVPSLWYETAALVIQEAFAAGVPVVASSLGALVERVRHGVDGLLTPPGDGRALAAILLSLSRDRSQLEGLRAQIRPVMTIDEHVDCVLAEYRRLANASGHR